MDRRRFLGVTGAATLALSGCGGGGGGTSSGSGISSSAGSTSTPAPTPSPGSPSTGPTTSDWQTLANELSGSLVQQGNSSYAEDSVVFNSIYDNVMPLAIVLCANANDVTQALAFVERFGLAVTARSGGHSYGGYSTGTGVVVDVNAINSIQINGNTATIGAGAKLVDIYSQLAAQGVSIPSGSCLTIGIAGITQGGGIGVLDRAYGLTCDNLLSAQVVTANGQLIECDAGNNSDLFWALRGGGGGNFGIVTSFTFQTFATSDLTSFSAAFQFSDAVSVFAAWQTWPQNLPDTVWSGMVLTGSSISISGVFIGNAADFAPYWNQFLAAAQANPIGTSVTTQSYTDTIVGGCGGLTISECHLPGETPDGEVARAAFAASSDFFNSPLPTAGIQAMLQAITTRQAANQPGIIILDLMGGAISKLAPNATAFVHRNALFSAQYYAEFSVGTSPGIVGQAQVWANGMRAVMQPWSSGEAYQNYIDPLLQNWQTAYYGSNYAQLVQVKEKYDPTGVFQFAQGV
jgi:FAD/FMN-containing dehydrogenase